ncbi:MAG: exo-alpha-sialidase [Clostridia bacterium]|nr:exo-alpha-sialidase [Clostridia bacterium]
MKKRILALLLAVVSLGAASCGGASGVVDTTDGAITDGVTTDAGSDAVTDEVSYPVLEPRLYTIDELNLGEAQWTHVGDDINTASLEVDYRSTVALYKDTTDSPRYDSAYYPRICKVKDDLYLLTWMGGQSGAHIYWTTSKDGVHWAKPEVLITHNSKENKFVHTEGPLKGTEDMFTPYNPDTCVLDNGDVLLVYYRRPLHGYAFGDYIDMNGIYLVRGTVTANNMIVWGKHERLTYGVGWEPYIWQRPDGRVEIYWSNTAPYVAMYGMDKDRRSAGTSLIYSDDNGKTWTPDIDAGRADNYMYIRAYQETVGMKVPYGKNPDGTDKYTEAVPYFGAQMPIATNMYNGKTFLAVEVAPWEGDARETDEEGSVLRDALWLTFATSGEGGEWKDLALLEDGYEIANAHGLPLGTAPYVSTFPSGEIYLTYGRESIPRGRMISPDGTTVSDYEFLPTPGIKANWGGHEIVGSHKVLTTYTDTQTGSARSVYIFTSYLNHRINAKNITVTADCGAGEWTENTDALFIGSETQAQMTVQVGHNKDTISFLINRLDDYLTDGDTVTLDIGVDKMKFYRVTVGFDGIREISCIDGGVMTAMTVDGTASVKTFGTVNDNSDTDEGAVYEIVLQKEMLGIVGAGSVKLCPSLGNMDGKGIVCDTLTGVGAFVTDTWPSVVLD